LHIILLLSEINYNYDLVKLCAIIRLVEVVEEKYQKPIEQYFGHTADTILRFNPPCIISPFYAVN